MVPAIVGIIGYFVVSFRQKAPLPIDRNLGMFFALIAVLSLVSALWSANASEVLCRSLNSAGIFIGALLFLSFIRTQTFSRKGAAIAFLMTYSAIGLYFYGEYKFGAPIATYFQENFLWYYFNRSMVVYALLFLPALYLAGKTFTNLKTYIPVVLTISLCAFATLSTTSSQTAQIILISGLAGYGILTLLKGTRARWWVLNVSMLAICIAILVAPLLPGVLSQQMNNSIEQTSFSVNANIPQRLEIWNFVVTKIAEKPLVGHGIEATRSLKTNMLQTYNKADSILHPHNGYLQVWVELGLIGALLLCAFVVFMLYRIGKSPSHAQPLYFGVLLGVLTMTSTGYGIWQSWQLGMLVAISGICLYFTAIPDQKKA